MTSSVSWRRASQLRQRSAKPATIPIFGIWTVCSGFVPFSSSILDFHGPVPRPPFVAHHKRVKVGNVFKIYVGNLNFRTTQDGLQELFGAYGAVSEVFLATDRETGRSRGFGFVTMADRGQGEAAVTALNGKDFDGRNLVVNEARPREERPRGGGGGGGYGGGGGGGGRGGYGGGGGGRGGYGRGDR